MERLYRIQVTVAAAIALACALVGGLTLAGIAPLPDHPPIWVPLSVCLTFLLLNGLLCLFRNRLRGFPWPRARGAGVILALAITVATMAYGASRWPTAPLRRLGQAYVDKGGRPYDERSYWAFKRWETALLFLVIPLNLAVITSLPLARRRADSQA